MNFNIIFSGVGGQGVLSLAAIISKAASDLGLYAKQSEIHGMSQRGGAVMATLRLSDRPIESILIPDGQGNMLISVEPLESIRNLPMLAKDAVVITATAPFKNIPDYPNLEELLAAIRSLPKAILVNADQLAMEAGSARTANVVLVGAAAKFLPFEKSTLEKSITKMFERKGKAIVEANIKAFQLGSMVK